MAYDGSKSFLIPPGRVGVIRAFSYLIQNASSGGPLGGYEPLIGSRNFQIRVNGVAAEGVPLAGVGLWPDAIWDQEVFILCPENSLVQFVFLGLADDDAVQIKVYGNLLPTHGLPPAWEIASMNNLGAQA